jgi:Family of unknown function (DUF6847)
MKLAEALIERKALKEKIARLRERLVENAKIQEGDAPQEDPRALLNEVDAALREMARLTARINATNIGTPLEANDARSLMDGIAERDMLALKRAIVQQLVGAATITREHGYTITRSEIKFRPTVDVAALQKELDALAKQYRELDTQIQTRNFAIELME